LVAALRCSSI